MEISESLAKQAQKVSIEMTLVDIVLLSSFKLDQVPGIYDAFKAQGINVDMYPYGVIKEAEGKFFAYLTGPDEYDAGDVIFDLETEVLQEYMTQLIIERQKRLDEGI